MLKARTAHTAIPSFTRFDAYLLCISFSCMPIVVKDRGSAQLSRAFLLLLISYLFYCFFDSTPSVVLVRPSLFHHSSGYAHFDDWWLNVSINFWGIENSIEIEFKLWHPIISHLRQCLEWLKSLQQHDTSTIGWTQKSIILICLSCQSFWEVFIDCHVQCSSYGAVPLLRYGTRQYDELNKYDSKCTFLSYPQRFLCPFYLHLGSYDHLFENVRRKCRSAYRFYINCCTQNACWTWQNSNKTEQLTIVHTLWKGERNQSHRNENVEQGSYGAINKINKHVWESNHRHGIRLTTYIFEWLVENSIFSFCWSFLEFPNGLRITRRLFTVGRRIRVHSPVADHYPLKINKYRRWSRRPNFICDCWLSPATTHSWSWHILLAFNQIGNQSINR